MTLLVLLFFHLFLLLKTQFTLWPEMAVYPYLLNSGFLLYRDIINPYPPLLTYTLAAFTKVSGYDPLPFQMLTWGLVLTIDLLIFYLVKKTTKSTGAAILGVSFFVLFSIPFGVNGLWFDSVQTPFVLLAVYFFSRVLSARGSRAVRLLRVPTRTDFVRTITLLTVAFFVKQQVLWLIIWFAAVFIFRFKKQSIKMLFENKLAFIIPVVLFAISTLVFLKLGTLREYLYFSYYFPFVKASQMPGYVALPTFRQLIIVAVLIVPFLTLVSKKDFGKNFMILSGVVLALFAYPRFDYFHLVPALAVFSVALGQNYTKLSKLKIPVKFIVAGSLIILVVTSARYYKNHSDKEVRFFESDILRSASFLRLIAEKGDIIYIQNGPDQLLFLTGLIPTKPWATQFPWYLEEGDIQSRIIEGIQKDNPGYIVFKPYDPGSTYQLGTYRPQKIADYIDDNYANFFQISDTLWLKVKK